MPDPHNRADETYTPRLLIADDEADTRLLVRRGFRDAYAVHEATDGAGALQCVAHFKPHVIIADQRMPEMNGGELLARVREQHPHIVRVLMTGFGDHTTAVEAVNAAQVHYYLAKPFDVSEARRAVDALLRVAELEVERDRLLGELRSSLNRREGAGTPRLSTPDETTRLVQVRTQELSRDLEVLAAANLRLRDLAARDALTHLFNRRSLEELLQIELARSQRYQRELSLLFVDVDNFKSINDNNGHQVGDVVLRNIAGLLGGSHSDLRRSEFAARYGGEEFCVVLPETGLEGGYIKAERLRAAVETFDWRTRVPGLQREVTISVGVAGFPKHGNSLEPLLLNADAALYQAKQQGKNRVVVREAE